MAEYLVDLNGTQAAIRCGYSPKAAAQQSSHLLSIPKIAAAIAEGKAKQLQKVNLTAERVLEELRRLALSDVRKLFDANSNLLPPAEWDDDAAASVGGIEVVRRRSDDETTEDLHKIKVWDKNAALGNLAKHFGLLLEKVEHSGQVDMRTRVVHEHRPKSR